MRSPDTHFSGNSTGNAFGASRGSTGNIGRVPFGQTTSALSFNVQAAAQQAVANIGKGSHGDGNRLILGFGRGSSRGASNGRDRYRNTSNLENYEATSQDNSQI